MLLLECFPLAGSTKFEPDPGLPKSNNGQKSKVLPLEFFFSHSNAGFFIKHVWSTTHVNPELIISLCSKKQKRRKKV